MRSVQFLSRQGHSDARGQDMLLLLNQKIEFSLVSSRVSPFKPEKSVHCTLIKFSTRAKVLTCLTLISFAGSVQTSVQNLVKSVLELALDSADDFETMLDRRAKSGKLDNDTCLSVLKLLDFFDHFCSHLLNFTIAIDVEKEGAQGLGCRLLLLDCVL